MNKTTAIVCACAAGIAGFTAGYLPHRGHAAARQPLYYVDPMHPAYRSAHPGKAPDCGMDLVPVFAEDLGGSLSRDNGRPGTLAVSPATQQLYGIQVARAGGTEGTETLHLSAHVAADETRVYRINLGTDGYVKETHGDAVGERVRKDQRLATVYSPEFLSVAGGYLSANERTPGSMGHEGLVPTANAASAQARADRLRNLGMSEAQIDEISKSRKLPEDIYLVSPVDGVIVGRDLSPGSRFDRHTDLYTVADLRRVWVDAQVFGPGAQALRPGANATVRIPDTGEVLRAQVSSLLPTVDPTTHAVTVRLEAANPGLRLRPGMLVGVELSFAHASRITVPAEAVLDSGLSKRVFVKTAEGVFEPRSVDTGWTLNDEVQIVKGLHEGEMVASAGTFLLDSESRLHAPGQADAAPAVAPVLPPMPVAKAIPKRKQGEAR